MASNITLSAGVRQNLLSLQSTADLMSTTQNRLATGKKVNSALDNPTSFFTAQSLQSRAGDMASLLDGMTSGVKTLEAADNGLSAITKTVESMQSTLRQARQDKSFKTDSYTIDTATIGTSTLKTLDLSGGAIGTTPVSVDLNTLAGANTPTTLAGTGATFGTNFAGGNIDINGTSVAIRGDQTAVATTLNAAGAAFGTNFADGVLTINGTNINITGDVLASASSVTGTGGSDLTADPDLSALTGESITLTAVGGATTTYSFTGAATGQAADLESDLEANGFTVARTANGLNVSRADGVEFTVTTSDPAVDTALGLTGGATTTNGTEAADADIASVLAEITGAGITGLTATNNAGQISLSLASGADITITGGLAATLGFTGGTASSTNGTVAFNADETTVEADLDASGITGLTASSAGGQVSLSLASGADVTIVGSTLATAIGFGTGNLTSTNGTTGAVGAVKSVDELVTSINSNTSLQGKVRASNDGGKLRIENISTTELTVEGVSAGGAVDGTATQTEIGGNSVRTNLVKQFNELRDQLDKLADDASYNGVNLLRGDLLKLTFNETGTSTIEIQAKDEDGAERAINSSTLGIDTATDADFDSDVGIDSILNGMKDALGVLRSQSSSFGSNLSIVQNRTEFTKSMINTLQTGADSLVLADTNEEAANMLALQTRQQLSSTALSLASQADQAVLRLF
jgi:flagellin-like hook-associated protein FlgL